MIEMKLDSFENEFNYVYSPIVKTYPSFIKEANYLVNRYDSDINDYEYISILSKEKFSNAKVNVCCDFHAYGAPIVVFGDDVSEQIGRDGSKHLFYGVHFEVVAWEEGCNIWYLVPDPDNSERPVKPTLLLGAKFPVEAGKPIYMTVKVTKGKVLAEINGNKCEVAHEKIPEVYYMGYTACEGINKLYSLKIE